MTKRINLPSAGIKLAVVVFTAALAACDPGDSPVAVPEDEAPAATEAAGLVEIFRLTLFDEYRAEAIYKGVMEDFGEILPFRNIARAEAQHARNVLALYASRGLTAPANPYTTADVPHFDGRQAACQAGVLAEIENIEMYDDILLLPDLPEDVVQAVTWNRLASLNGHLPAFEKCS